MDAASERSPILMKILHCIYMFKCQLFITKIVILCFVSLFTDNVMLYNAVRGLLNKLHVMWKLSSATHPMCSDVIAVTLSQLHCIT